MADSAKKPGIPRSSKYRNLAEVVAEHLARGNIITGVAGMFGIDRATLYNWLKLEHFNNLLDQKKEEWRSQLLKGIEGSNEWTAQAWLLERSPAFRGDYSPPAVQAKKVNIGSVNIFSHISEKTIRAILAEAPAEHESVAMVNKKMRS